ncbi:MAG TPA: hypothetical protein PLB01_04820 [Thermoanaerobaculia bacterium]|nr:hypothetical protein [Thermoanaerobaculia bacterium]
MTREDRPPRRAAANVAAFGLALVPAVLCISFGAFRAPLWLDEILYFYLQDDFALRAAEIGRPASSLAPYFGNFFFCDLQRLFQGLLGPLGLSVQSHPEATLRLLPLAAFLGACAIFYRSFLRQSGRLDAVLGTLAFSSMPLVLHYAFEARVYVFTAFLVVLLLSLLPRADEGVVPGRTVALAALGLVTAHSHLWTVCLFAALAADGALRLARSRGPTPQALARLAASLPALGLIVAEYAFMKFTDPGRPQYPPFRPQPLRLTLEELFVSNFSGPLHLQYYVFNQPSGKILVWAGAFLLVAIAILAWRHGDRERRRDILTAAAALALCAFLAVTFGFFQHARYHLPLLAALLFAFGPPRGSVPRGLLAGLVLVNLLLLPDNLEEMDRKSDGRRLAAHVARRFPDRSRVGVVFQNVPTGGYPFPSHSIAADFYMNFLHPNERPVSLYELPELNSVNGRRGVYPFFASDPSLLARTLKSRPEIWRSRLPLLPANLVLVNPIWGLEESQIQLADFLKIVRESPYRRSGSSFMMFGFPHLFMIELPAAPEGK